MSDQPLKREAGHNIAAPKRRLGNLLLDKQLQLRYVGFVTLVSALLSATLGFMVWAQANKASQTIIATLESQEYTDELKQMVIDRLASGDTNLLLVMGAAGIGMVVVLSLYLVVMTHKVAGPLRKISGYFDEMSQGKLSEVRPLRKGDQLVDFYNKFKEMHDVIRARQQLEIKELGAAVAACDRLGIEGDAVTKAKSHLELRRSQLE